MLASAMLGIWYTTGKVYEWAKPTYSARTDRNKKLNCGRGTARRSVSVKLVNVLHNCTINHM